LPVRRWQGAEALLGAGNFYGDAVLTEESVRFPALKALTSVTLLTLSKSKAEALARSTRRWQRPSPSSRAPACGGGPRGRIRRRGD